MLENVLTRDKILSVVLPLLKKYLAEKAILLGSYARNEADGHSDIDLLIIGSEHFDPTNIFCIADELYHSFGKAVDVYDISEINNGSDLYNTIFFEGIEIKTE